MDKYRTKPQIVEARVYSPAPLARGMIEDDFGVCHGYCMSTPHLHTNLALTAISPGDYIVYANNDTYVYTATEFNNKFEKLDETTKEV